MGGGRQSRGVGGRLGGMGVGGSGVRGRGVGGGRVSVTRGRGQVWGGVGVRGLVSGGGGGSGGWWRGWLSVGLGGGRVSGAVSGEAWLRGGRCGGRTPQLWIFTRHPGDSGPREESRAVTGNGRLSQESGHAGLWGLSARPCHRCGRGHE